MEKEKYYLIERNGQMVGLPISLLTDGERATIVSELRQQGKDHFEHAAELNGFALDKKDQRAGLILTDAERVKIVSELRKKGKEYFERADELNGFANHYREVEKLTKTSNDT